MTSIIINNLGGTRNIKEVLSVSAESTCICALN